MVGLDLARYGRHLSLPGFGIEGQERLRAARVAIVGLGGLGCPAAQYLAAAGVGTLGLIDGDRVEIANLQRQVLFGDADVGALKADVAATRLRAMNPELDVLAIADRLDSGNAMAALEGYDILVDATDNFPTRYLINDAAVLLGVPFVHGSVLRFEGRVSLFAGKGGPCYRCVYPEPPPPGVVEDCSDAGVLGVMTGLIGVLQATEVIKFISGFGERLSGRLLIVDGSDLRFLSVRIAQDPACPMCATREIRDLVDYDAFCAGPRPRDEVSSLSPSDAVARMGDGIQLIDVREPWEWEICHLPGATLLPLGQLGARLRELDASRETIVYCHRGMRSLDAARRLLSAGFSNVAHITGGIDRFSLEVDESLARY